MLAPPEGYRVRLATEGELARCTEIERRAAVRFAAFDLAEVMGTVLTPLEALQRGVRERGLFVATHPEDGVVGFALVAELDGEAHLLELDVLPEHGRKGLGRTLVIATLAWGYGHHLPRMTLSTLSFVPWNAPFYASLGFRVLQEHELSEGLKASRAEDRARGLPDDGRVIMGRDLPTR